MSFAFPVLVADIGGADARFSLKESAGAELSAPVHVRTGDYPGLAEAIKAILPKFAVHPKSVIACGAGAIRRAAHSKRTFRLKPPHEN
jgi:glucokinase